MPTFTTSSVSGMSSTVLQRAVYSFCFQTVLVRLTSRFILVAVKIIIIILKKIRDITMFANSQSQPQNGFGAPLKPSTGGIFGSQGGMFGSQSTGSMFGQQSQGFGSSMPVSNTNLQPQDFPGGQPQGGFVQQTQYKPIDANRYQYQQPNAQPGQNTQILGKVIAAPVQANQGGQMFGQGGFGQNQFQGAPMSMGQGMQGYGQMGFGKSSQMQQLGQNGFAGGQNNQSMAQASFQMNQGQLQPKIQNLSAAAAPAKVDQLQGLSNLAKPSGDGSIKNSVQIWDGAFKIVYLSKQHLIEVNQIKTGNPHLCHPIALQRQDIDSVLDSVNGQSLDPFKKYGFTSCALNVRRQPAVKSDKQEDSKHEIRSALSNDILKFLPTDQDCD